MKKKLILSAAVVAVVGAASFAALNSITQPRKYSALELANIEALCRNEGNGDKKTCYDAIKEKEGSQIFYCATCSWVMNSTDSFWADKKECPND